jgi:hypothetical protein
MSTTTPPDEDGAGTESEADPGDSPDTVATGGTAHHGTPRSPHATGTGRPDRWADSTADASERTSPAAPLAFDPTCARRLRNCIDGANAAFPDAR